MVPQVANVLVAPNGFDQIEEFFKHHHEHIVAVYRAGFHTIENFACIALINKRTEQPIPNDEHPCVVAINLFLTITVVHAVV